MELCVDFPRAKYVVTALEATAYDEPVLLHELKVSEAEYPSQTPDWKPRTRKWYKHDKLRIYLLGD